MTLGRIALVAVIAFAAAVVGSYTGRTLSPSQHETGAELHAVMHDDMNLDAAQKRQLELLERDFKRRRELLESRLLADNQGLAQAIAAEHVYGPRVSVAVDATHDSMGALQKATLEHIFAMRGILRPEQQVRFDEAVDQALTAETR